VKSWPRRRTLDSKPDVDLIVAAEVAAIVRPVWATIERVRVLDRDPRQDAPLRAAAAALRARVESADMATAVRYMYKQIGLDPTKTRPSSEALLRRLRKGDEFPRINSLVDVVNWCSAESQLPFGLYDLNRITLDAAISAVTLRLGRPGEAYAGIRKDVVHVDGRLVLADAQGPFGNPTSDSGRTMVTVGTTRALVVIFGPAGVGASIADRALRTTLDRIRDFTGV
jgi:DNA/RNA-binding domain of Phe-tRNA-synthetase-like protein